MYAILAIVSFANLNITAPPLSADTLEAFFATMSLPKVEARVWLTRTGVLVRLMPSFHHFQAAVVNALCLPVAARLYWFPDERCIITEHRLLKDDESFMRFRAERVRGQCSVVWAYLPPATGGPVSPEDAPVALPPASSPAARVASSAGTRDSHQQREFRASLETRDGKNCCVACGATCHTEAAHIVRHRAAKALVCEAGLLSTWDVRNGFMLCHTCHLFFYKHLWCVGENGKVEIAEALLADTECGPHFRQLVGVELRHTAGDCNWPAAATWRCHRQLFLAARSKRHVEQADSKFLCDDCGALFAISSRFKYHVEAKSACESRPRRGERRLWTPAEKLAFPALAVAAEELEGVVRRLSLVAEDAGGTAAAAAAGDASLSDEEDSVKSSDM